MRFAVCTGGDARGRSRNVTADAVAGGTAFEKTVIATIEPIAIGIDPIIGGIVGGRVNFDVCIVAIGAAAFAGCEGIAVLIDTIDAVTVVVSTGFGAMRLQQKQTVCISLCDG